MNGVGVSHSAISVINAIPCGIGAVIGTDLVTQAMFRPGDGHLRIRIDNDPGADTGLARTCVERASELMGSKEKGGDLHITSQIPISRGLKSSSAAANAILAAVFRAHGKEVAPLDMLRLGSACAREAGVSVTGAFDDACGCLFGGFVMTDNREDRVLLARDIDEMDVILHIPAEKIVKKDPRMDVLKAKGEEMSAIVDIAGDEPLRAMTLNGRLVAGCLSLDNRVAEKALGLGALAAGISGTGPATAILTVKGTGKDMIRELDEENLILTRTRRLEDGPLF